MSYTFEPFTIDALGTTFRIRPYVAFAEHGYITLAQVLPPQTAEHRDVPFIINNVQYVGNAYIEYRDDHGLTLTTSHIHRPPHNYSAGLTDAARKTFYSALQPALDTLRHPTAADVVAILEDDARAEVRSRIERVYSEMSSKGYQLFGRSYGRWAGQADDYAQHVKAGIKAGAQEWLAGNA